MKIKYNTIGLIKSGDMEGWQIKVVPDEKGSTGGIFILQSRDFSNNKAEAYDDWVESEESLKRYFEESNWNIEW